MDARVKKANELVVAAIRYLERYPQLAGKSDRTALRRLYRLREHQRAVDALPISLEQLEPLVRFIEDALVSEPCDHSLQHAATWALDNRILKEELMLGLQSRGG